jgi:hypothetical protein
MVLAEHILTSTFGSGDRIIPLRDRYCCTPLRSPGRERFTFLGYSFGPHHPYNPSARMHLYMSASPSKKVMLSRGDYHAKGLRSPWTG